MNVKKYNLSEEEIKTERKSVIQTVVWSLTFPLLCWILLTLPNVNWELLMLIYVILNTIIYYCVILRKRKNDVFIDSNKRRIKISLIIQFIVFLILGIVIFCYAAMAAIESEKGHIGDVYIFFYPLVIPVIIHIFSMIFLIAERLIRFFVGLFSRD